MAYSVRKINPLDLQPRKAVGVALPFSGKAVFNQTYQTKDAIKNNLINYLLTGEGERYMNPVFGTPLRNLLFENQTQDNISSIRDTIYRAISEYFPRVNISQLDLIGAPDTNTVTLSMRFSVRETNIEEEININFEQ